MNLGSEETCLGLNLDVDESFQSFQTAFHRIYARKSFRHTPVCLPLGWYHAHNYPANSSFSSHFITGNSVVSICRMADGLAWVALICPFGSQGQAVSRRYFA
jgi:hypothetical protein